MCGKEGEGMGSLSTLLVENPTGATKELSFCSQKLAASWLGPQPASPGSSSKCDTARNQPVLPASCVMLRGKENQALVSAPVATSGHLLLRQICCAWGGDSAACGQEFHYLRAEAEPGASALPRQAFTRAGVEDALKGRWYLAEAPFCAVQGLYLGGLE